MVSLFQQYKSDAKCGVNNLTIRVMRLVYCLMHWFGADNHDLLLIRNPRNYYGGFTVSYLFKGRVLWFILLF
jgi:hypothetical protein